MRFILNLRFLLVILSLLISQVSFASPVRYDVTGLLKTSGADSPYPNNSVINGWYTLDWDNAVYEYDSGGSTYYSGILNFEFVIDNKYHIDNFGQLSQTYYDVSLGDPPVENNFMGFRALEPNVDTFGVYAIEELYLSIYKGQGDPLTTLWFFSTTDGFDDAYEGSSDLHYTHNVRAPEPGTLMLLLLGLASIFYARFKFRPNL